jgi:hypothetical protein
MPPTLLAAAEEVGDQRNFGLSCRDGYRQSAARRGELRF